jgi:hypothetical protein
MMPIVQPTGGARLSQLFQAVSNRGETYNRLILLTKMAAVSPFHRFWGMLPVKFWWGSAAAKNSGEPIPRKRETAKQIAIFFVISMDCLFHLGLKQLETVEQFRPKDVPAHAER